MNRRDFLATAAAAAAGVTQLPAAAGERSASPSSRPGAPAAPSAASPLATPPASLPDLAPARWIWLPSGRTLANTFVLFRRELVLEAAPRRAVGWLAADSRYRLHVNGRSLQWGPAPADPRWAEADPIDLTASLVAGRNVIGAVVLYYGHGEGTWPLGKPGFLFRLEIEHADGRREVLGSDAGWKVQLCRAWPPGRFKRWYLRSLQEEFDARAFPWGWDTPEFAPGPGWLPAQVLAGSPNKPALATSYYEYTTDVGAGGPDTELRPRSIPLLREERIPVARLAASHRLRWKVPPRDYFDFRMPDAFDTDRTPCAETLVGEGEDRGWRVRLDGAPGSGAVLTFELAKQVVGWPGFTIDAPEGTEVEMLVHEAHDPGPGGPGLMNSHFDSWTRFVCRRGPTEFEPFDFESLRWIQLHLHGPVAGEAIIRGVRVRRRVYPWPNTPRVRCGEASLQRLFDATLNTLDNCAQETLVDGMARERQQYSGDCGHQIHALHLAYGETRLPARYLVTWSQGLTKDGYFLDCWPAFDRLARLVERQFDLTGWGPILDHGVGFNFDCWHQYLHTGDLGPLREPFPRLLRFAEYLRGLAGTDGLLPVESLGIPSVWIDHNAFQKPRHKQCAFNLYVAAAFRHALAPLAQAFGDPRSAQSAREFADRTLRATVRRFWNRDRRLFVNNQPWRGEEPGPRMCDRSLATAVLFDQSPRGDSPAAIAALADPPPELGLSYPANAPWRLWALGKGGRAEVVARDLRERWATMASVVQNLTLQEDWEARPDSGQQWSHCAVAPVFLAYHVFAGIRPLAPGWSRYEVRPQLADLPDLELVAHTPGGPLRFDARGPSPSRSITLTTPASGDGELVVGAGVAVELPPVRSAESRGDRRYRLPRGSEVRLTLG